MSSSPFLYPNVTSIPGNAGAGDVDKAQPKRQAGVPSEFDSALDEALKPSAPGGAGLSSDLSRIRAPLKFSGHAQQRLNDRKIKIDEKMMIKVNDAVDKAAAKGLEDTLILTPDAALIVSVKNRTVVTAMDRNSLSGNVFTNIDGAVIL